MRVCIDLDSEKMVAGVGVNDPLTELDFKRSPTSFLEVQFTQGGLVVELPVGASGVWGIKPTGEFDADYLCAALAWVKSGTGADTVYTFTFSFINAAIDALFFVDGNVENDVAQLTFMGELQWTSGNVAKTQTLVVNVVNDVNRGGETAPDPSPVSYGAFLLEINALTGGAANDLDAFPTLKLNTGTIVLVMVTIDSERQWLAFQLTQGAATAAAPAQVQPLDDGTRHWLGAVGPRGVDGVGVPVGGSTGQALTKASSADFDTQWSNIFNGEFASLSGLPTTLAGYGIADAQPLSSQLTALAALTTTSFGRGLLSLADAAAGRSAFGLGTAAVADTGTSSGNVPLLDGTGKIPTSLLPSSVLGDVQYQGAWDASANSPAIPAAASGNKGQYYVVGTAGSTSIDGQSDWKIGDWLVSNGATWDKIDNTDLVTSVAGRMGAVVLNTADVNDSTNRRYVSDAQLVVISNTSGVNTGDQNLSGLAVAGRVASSGLTTATARLIGRTTVGTGALEELSAADTKTFLAIASSDVSGLAASATTDTTSASNISAGTLADARIAAALTGKTYNGLTLTAASTGWTIAGGTASKTLTLSNTLTLAGTDAATLNIGAGGNLGSAAFTAATAYDVAGAAAAVTKTTLGLGSVENTALSTWAGTANITTLGTIGTGTWNGGVVAGQYGGTGVANTGKTITLGGNFVASGAFALTLTTTATTNVTLPTTGTLLTSAGAVTSLTGTANEITASASTGAVVLSLPSAMTLTGITLQGGIYKNFSISQANNGDAAVIGIRATDTAPAGVFMQFETAGFSPLWSVNINGVQTIYTPIAANTSGDGLILSQNSGVAVASSGNQYYSSRARFSGFGWATTPAASQQVDAIIELRPVQGAATPTSLFAIATQINGGGYTDRLTMTNAGDVVINLNATALAAETEFPGQLGLQIAGVDGSVVRFLVDAFGGVPAMYFRSAGGTNAAKTALASGVGMFSFGAGGYYGAGYAPAKILIGGFAAEAWDSTHTGAYFGFYTTPLGTAQGTGATEVMRLQASGGVTIGHSIIATDPGIGNLTLAGVYKVGANQVVGARVTGYTAMTGTPDKATAFATSTVTLAQLAGRMMQLQADLTAHGLIGA